MGDISVHFNRDEFACQCGCGFDTVDALLLEALESIRAHFERPIRVTSGCRCKGHNASVGGTPRSLHKQGRAADIQVSKVPPEEVATLAEALGMSVGRYKTFTHVDSRTGVPKRWASSD
jgi:uncharacterized protein YcbK (DUF882 family)